MYSSQHSSQHLGIWTVRLVGLMLLFLALVTADARAQRFKSMFGGANCSESGYGGVQPLANGAGYVAVGTTRSTSGNCASTDIYVARFGNNGLLMPGWARTYSIGVNDSAMDIRECANGDFIITGWVDTVTIGSAVRLEDIFLLRITSAGVVLWAQVYGTNDLRERAFSVEEATTGDGDKVKIGDFIVGGVRYPSSGQFEAYLFRTDANGVLMWDKTYAIPDWVYTIFMGVDEATNGVGANQAGDILATGGAFSGNERNDWDMFVVRVSGIDGTISGGSQGAAVWDCDSSELGWNIRELSVGAEAGNIVVLGTRYTPNFSMNQPRDVFVWKSGANPATSGYVDQLYHASQCIGDEGTWIREITGGGAGVRTGNMIIAGTDHIQTGKSAFLLEIRPNLAVEPAPGVGFTRYGNNFMRGSYGRSVHPVSCGNNRTSGFVLCGTVEYGVTTRDLFIVKTDTAGVACDTDTPYDENDPDAPRTEVTPELMSLDQQQEVTPSTAAINDDSVYCVTNYSCPSARETTPGNELVEMIAGALDLYPNPIVPGSTIDLRYVLATKGTVEITVSDMNGRLIHAVQASGDAGALTIPVSTAGWATGVYMVKVEHDGKTATSRIIVTD